MMNWFDTSGLTTFAKTALKTIDKALDIQDESGDELEDDNAISTKIIKKPGTVTNEDSNFFSTWGLTVSAESSKELPSKEHPVVTESPSKSGSQSAWGSFAGSFFEQPNTIQNSTVVQPPKAKSMNVIPDTSFGSQDDLFSRSQLVMSEGTDMLLQDKEKTKGTISKEESGDSSQSQKLSLVLSPNSSESLEVLSHSMKTTPDSDIALSVHSLSHSSSVSQKLNSESVEILSDSHLSPSSIECLGFDSSASDKNSSPSSNLSPIDLSDKKSTTVGDRTEIETADSVSLVADDDEDTVSYNSVSESTAPTILGNEDKPIITFPKVIRTEPQRKVAEIELIHLEQPIITQKMQLSENSSNDGSWSDRTLNADNDSVNFDITSSETATDQQNKGKEQDDILLEKLSDSSSFYNIKITSDMLQSESSSFVNVEKQQCSAQDSSDSSQKESSIKERSSPISSDSKSDLVKLGSDRTSGHTSGDEVETTTSSDIEIIPSPNGENSHGFCRNSPGKYACKYKLDGATSPNLVDLVLGKTLATKVRGHNRELSEASVQSNTSDESQGSENDRLMKRLCEMAEILEARENRLLEVSRSNTELTENNAHLKSQVESLLAKHEVGDINTITEDYTQRMSALEKKFQQAIREKDQLRKQLDSLKNECLSRKNSSALENSLKEKDDIIAQLQEEGEKLARQQLQHSNIIKKLRAKEKDNEQVLKSLRDKISEQTSELDRLKRSLAAKEEIEVNQIETVYRLTTTNKKYETELMEARSQLDDTTRKLETTHTSLEAARKEITEAQRNSIETQRRRDAYEALEADKRRFEAECERLSAEVHQLRTEMVQESARCMSREQALRQELQEVREQCAVLESGGGGGTGGGGDGTAALLAQLASLQRSVTQREQAHATAIALLRHQLAEAATSAAKAIERERLTREECDTMHDRVQQTEAELQETAARVEALSQQCQRLVASEQLLESKTNEIQQLKTTHEERVRELQLRISHLEEELLNERSALDTEKKRNAILQEQVSFRGDSSPPHSVTSDSLPAALWLSEEGGRGSPSMWLGGGYSGGMSSMSTVQELVSTLQRREGEVRAMGDTCRLLEAERRALRDTIAELQATLTDTQSFKEQYDALLQMYGEKEEQLEELKLDLQDVTQLYKAQLDELIALRRNRDTNR